MKIYGVIIYRIIKDNKYPVTATCLLRKCPMCIYEYHGAECIVLLKKEHKMWVAMQI